MLTDGKTRDCGDVSPSRLALQVQCQPHQSPSELATNRLWFPWEEVKTQKTQHGSEGGRTKPEA